MDDVLTLRKPNLDELEKGVQDWFIVYILKQEI